MKEYYYKCLWKIASQDENSTTFLDYKNNAQLVKCKEVCTGYDSKCPYCAIQTIKV